MWKSKNKCMGEIMFLALFNISARKPFQATPEKIVHLLHEQPYEEEKLF